MAKKVVCLNTGKVFDSIAQAATSVKTSASRISEACRGIALHAGKDIHTNQRLQWAFQEDYEAGKKSFNPTPYTRKMKRVVCLNTGHIYESTQEVADLMGVPLLNIAKACSGHSKTCGWSNVRKEALQWAYEEDVLSGARSFVPGLESYKSVICITTGEVFEKTEVAAKVTGICSANIRSNCKGKTSFAGVDAETQSPLQWAYWEDYKRKPIPLKTTPTYRTKVICVTTGVVYNSYSAAEKANNIAKGGISRCVERIEKGMYSATKCKTSGQPLIWMNYDMFTQIKDVESFLNDLGRQGLKNKKTS